MNISLSSMLATSAWMAFLSVLALIGIIVAGGFIVALLGKMVLSVLSPKAQDDVRQVDEFGYTNEQGTYVTQSQEMAQHNVIAQPKVQTTPEDDYAYAVDVDNDLAKAEKEALDKEPSNKVEEDDFFDDFTGEDDVRFGDDDLMGMIDEISQDILDEEEQTSVKAQQAEDEATKSVLNKYSIDDYFNEDKEELDLIDDVVNLEKYDLIQGKRGMVFCLKS